MPAKYHALYVLALVAVSLAVGANTTYAYDPPNVWTSPYFNFDGDFWDACATPSFCVSLDTNNEGSGNSDWQGFVYSSSTVSTIDTIYFMALPSSTTTPASVRWEVYKSTDPYNGGSLVGFTDYVEIPYQYNISASTTKTYSAYFNTPFDIGGAYYYRFVFATQQGEDAGFYSHTDYGLNGGTLNKQIWGVTCTNSSASTCDGLLDEWQASVYSTGTTTPAVALTYNGSPLTGEYITTQTPCTTNSNTNPTNACDQIPTTEVSVSGFVNIETDNKKVSIYLRDKYLNTLDSISMYYTGAGYFDFEHTFTGLQASTTYNIYTCLSDAGAFPEFASIQPECTTIIFTNGDNPMSYDEYWCELFPEDSQCTASTTSQTAWEEMGCNDLDITDVFLGVKCALVWAFVPAQQSVESFQEARNTVLSVYPIGYATHMYLDISEAFSTTTTLMDRSVNIGAWFGRPTTTVQLEFDTLTQYVHILDPLFKLFDNILWFIFTIWFLKWAYSRRMNE